MFEIVPGDGLDLAPRLSIASLSLTIGPYAGPDDHEKHVLQTVGSGNSYFSEYDELRFDPVTGLLQSLQLHIPERNAARAWPELPATPGSIRLTSPGPFDHEPAALRRASATSLTCMYTVDTPDRRVTVTEDFDLLFTGGELAGWRVADPERHLEPAPGPADPALAALLHSYFELVAEPGIERLEDEDPGMRRAIEELAGRVGTTSDQRRTLHDRLIDLVDFFYG